MSCPLIEEGSLPIQKPNHNINTNEHSTNNDNSGAYQQHKQSEQTVQTTQNRNISHKIKEDGIMIGGGPSDEQSLMQTERNQCQAPDKQTYQEEEEKHG